MRTDTLIRDAVRAFINVIKGISPDEALKAYPNDVCDGFPVSAEYQLDEALALIGITVIPGHADDYVIIGVYEEHEELMNLDDAELERILILYVTDQLEYAMAAEEDRRAA